jgi:hypothetical protein
MALPAGFARHPGTNLPGRIMTHVLAVPALQLGYPVAFIVLMETGYPPLHESPDRRAGLLRAPGEAPSRRQYRERQDHEHQLAERWAQV